MHDARSPVPLKCIVIRVSSETEENNCTEPMETELGLSAESIILPEIENLPDIDSSLEEPEEINPTNIADPPH